MDGRVETVGGRDDGEGRVGGEGRRLQDSRARMRAAR